MSLQTHLPPHWRERLLALLLCPTSPANMQLLDAWQRAEGGHAQWNPLNTTEPMHGTTDYNSVGVKNYPTPVCGIAATALTLILAPYHSLWVDLQAGGYSARQLVERNEHAFNTWGTGASHILALLT